MTGIFYNIPFSEKKIYSMSNIYFFFKQTKLFFVRLGVVIAKDSSQHGKNLVKNLKTMKKSQFLELANI